MNTRWLNLSAIVVLTILAYSPALRGGFIWDDEAYISRNPELETLSGLRHIWMTPGATQQYYPMTFTVLWMEHHLWGLSPLGYHLGNVLLHSMNAILIGMLLELLGMPGAWIAAWLFALHPVHVESVAWMTELKNTLSTFFYLVSAYCLLKNRMDRPPKALLTLAAFTFFVLALLSKSVTATLPIIVLTLTYWITGSLQRRDLYEQSPFIAAGLGIGLFTLYFERHWVGAAGGMPWILSRSDRIVIAGHAFWFYLTKLAYPSALVFIYPRWPMIGHEPFLFFYPIAALGALALAVYGQKWWGKIPFAGLLFFVITLSPILGLLNFYYMRFSFVADHFQYLASIGIFAACGWGLSRLLAALDIEGSILSTVLVGMLCLNLGLTTARSARRFEGPLPLWKHTLEYNPDSAIAHHNIGIAYSQQNQWKDALAHLRTAEALDPAYPQTHLALAYYAFQAKRWSDARHQYQEAFRLGIRDPQVLKDYASLPQ